MAESLDGNIGFLFGQRSIFIGWDGETTGKLSCIKKNCLAKLIVSSLKQLCKGEACKVWVFFYFLNMKAH